MLIGNAEDSNSCDQLVEEPFVVDGVLDLCVVDMDEFGDEIVGIGHYVFAKRTVLVNQMMNAFPVELAKKFVFTIKIIGICDQEIDYVVAILVRKLYLP